MKFSRYFLMLSLSLVVSTLCAKTVSVQKAVVGEEYPISAIKDLQFSKDNTFTKGEMVVVNTNQGLLYGKIKRDIDTILPHEFDGEYYEVDTQEGKKRRDITRQNIFTARKIGKIIDKANNNN